MELIRTIVKSTKEPIFKEVAWLDTRNNRFQLKFYRNGEWINIYAPDMDFKYLSKEEAAKLYALKTDIPDTSSFITNTVDNLVNYYKKTETYNKEEVDRKIVELAAVKLKAVDSLPVVGESNIIYLVPAKTSYESNYKEEYIWVDNRWELIGTTKVDLSDYVSKAELYAIADNEDLAFNDGKLHLADKSYSPEQFSGLGRVYLRKNIVDGNNILTQEMINLPNTIYIIQYDYDLNGATINIPENCTLKFEGGSLSNGTLSLNNTLINSVPLQIFKDVVITGKSISEFALSEWFGAKGDGINDDTKAIQDALKYLSVVKLCANKNYFITDTIELAYRNQLSGTTNTTVSANGNFKLFKIGHSVRVSDFEVMLNLPQTVFYILGAYIYDSYGREHEPVGMIENAEIDIKNINIISMVLDNGESNINCIESIAGTTKWAGYARMRFRDIKIWGSYKNAIYLYNYNTGWQTDQTYTNINVSKCLNTIYIDKDREETFTPSHIVFDMVTSQFRPNETKGFAILKNAGSITFRQCIPWDWEFEENRPFQIDLEKCSGIVIEGDQTMTGKYPITNISSTGVEKYPPTIINTTNSYVAGTVIKLSFKFSEERLNSGKTMTIGEALSLSSGNYQIFAEGKMREFLGITYGIDPTSAFFSDAILSVNHINDVITLLQLFSKPESKLKTGVTVGFTIVISRGNDLDEPIPKFLFPSPTTKEFDSVNDIVNTDLSTNNILSILKKGQNKQLCFLGQGTGYLFDALGYKLTDIHGDKFPEEQLNYIQNQGKQFYRTDLKKPYFYDGEKWLDANGISTDAKTSGTFAQKPLGSTGIPVGFQYFCTDKQTTEGAANGIMIYYKGSDVWVDALGRVVSDLNPPEPPKPDKGMLNIEYSFNGLRPPAKSIKLTINNQMFELPQGLETSFNTGIPLNSFDVGSTITISSVSESVLNIVDKTVSGVIVKMDLPYHTMHFNSIPVTYNTTQTPTENSSLVLSLVPGMKTI